MKSRFLFGFMTIIVLSLLSGYDITLNSDRSRGQTIPPGTTVPPGPTVPPMPNPTFPPGFGLPGRGVSPLVLRGDQIEQLLGAATGTLVAYRYRADMGSWLPIPFQIDEVDQSGAYVAPGNGLLDAGDELVVMLRDLGDQAGELSVYRSFTGQVVAWYEVEVTDPLDPAARRWLYIMQFQTPQAPSVADYVSFDHGFHRIISPVYALGLGVTHPGADYLRLGNGPEILDRIKMRVECVTPLVCPVTENSQAGVADGMVKDGPVRVILRHGDLLAYDMSLQWTTPFTATAGPVHFSFDFNPFVSGARYYNAVSPRGVTIDGRQDFILRQPFSRWWQVSTTVHSIVGVVNPGDSSIVWTNLYLDSNDHDDNDTGDHQHFGETGIFAESLSGLYTFSFALYFIPGPQGSMGDRFMTLHDTPVAASMSHFELDPSGLPERVYMPIVSR